MSAEWVGPDGDPWGIRVRDAEDLVMALEDLPEGAELWKIHATGNLGVVVEGKLAGVLDLQTGAYEETT